MQTLEHMQQFFRSQRLQAESSSTSVDLGASQTRPRGKSVIETWVCKSGNSTTKAPIRRENSTPEMDQWHGLEVRSVSYKEGWFC